MVFGFSFSGEKNKYSQTTNESGNFENTYSRAPTIPDYWQSAYQGMLNQYAPAYGAGQGAPANQKPQMETATSGGHMAAQPGLTGLQSQGANYVSGLVEGGDPAQAGVNAAVGNINQLAGNMQGFGGDLAGLNRTYLPHLINQSANTIAGLERDYPDLYQKASDVAAQQIAAQQISATMGHEHADPYLNKYLGDVVDTSLADYDVGVDRQQNMSRARQAAAGAFGSRSNVYNAIADAEAARGRGSLAAGLRYGAQDRAFGLGQQDAGRVLTADQTNAANDLRAQQFNAANDLGAQQFNAQRNDARTMFDVNEAMRRDQFRANIANQMAGNILGQAGLNQGAASMYGDAAGLGIAGSQLGTANANLLFNMGGAQFDNPFNLLGLGTSTFGEEGTEAGVYDSTTSTRGKGTRFKGGSSASIP